MAFSCPLVQGIKLGTFVAAECRPAQCKAPKGHSCWCCCSKSKETVKKSGELNISFFCLAHLCGSSDHVFDIVSMARAIHMGIMPPLGLVLHCSSTAQHEATASCWSGTPALGSTRWNTASLQLCQWLNGERSSHRCPVRGQQRR